MPNTTARFALNRFEYGETWDDPDASGVSSGSPDGHTDTVETLDELAIERGPVADRPATGNYSDEFYFATDEDERTLYRWNESASAWDDELTRNVSLFAGTGLEDDGDDNLRIAAVAAGDGLKGGGGVALAVEPEDFAGDGLDDDGADNLAVNESEADHDALLNFVGDEHVDHGSVSVVAGAGLTGGGDLTASRTLDQHNVTERSADFTLSENDIALVDASGGVVLATLPSPSTDLHATVKKVDGSQNNVSIQTPGSETIDRKPELNISAQDVSRTITANATDYFVV